MNPRGTGEKEGEERYDPFGLGKRQEMRNVHSLEPFDIWGPSNLNPASDPMLHHPARPRFSEVEPIGPSLSGHIAPNNGNSHLGGKNLPTNNQPLPNSLWNVDFDSSFKPSALASLDEEEAIWRSIHSFPPSNPSNLNSTIESNANSSSFLPFWTPFNANPNEHISPFSNPPASTLPTFAHFHTSPASTRKSSFVGINENVASLEEFSKMEKGMDSWNGSNLSAGINQNPPTSGAMPVQAVPGAVNVDKNAAPNLFPCKFYASKSCKNGDSCPFYHGEPANASKNGKKIPTLCKYYASGYCREGDLCPFVHDSSALKTLNAKTIASTDPKVYSKSSDSIIPSKGDPLRMSGEFLRDGERKAGILVIPPSLMEKRMKKEKPENSGKKEAKKREIQEKTAQQKQEDIQLQREKALEKELQEKKEREELMAKKEKERKEKAEKEKERKEKERLDRERFEKERLELERWENLERERIQQIERERAEKAEKEKQERDRIAREKAEKERKEKQEKKRLEKEKMEKEKKEKEAAERERKEKERIQAENIKREREAALAKELEEKHHLNNTDQAIPSNHIRRDSSASEGEDSTDSSMGDNDFDGVPDLVDDDGGDAEEAQPRNPQNLEKKYTIDEEAKRVEGARNHYEVLNVRPDAQAKTVERRYKRLAEKLHPNKNVGNRRVSSAFDLVNAAYSTIGDAKKRLQYDVLLQNGEGDLELKENEQGGRISGGFFGLLDGSVGLLFMVLLLLMRLLRGFLIMVWSIFKFRPQRESRWCEGCKEYHVVPSSGYSSDGEVWEENGNYFTRKDGAIHDVTELIRRGLFEQQEEESDASEEENQMNSNQYQQYLQHYFQALTYPKGKKNKKKQIKLRR
eukprot:TRINITY_DN1949_c0_g1_i1.p1 TRINITY_DN1949_c0_g1~~TRINITY_DN1949_c0_g1_i1.p1  ORF type:complete len:864 (-),score=350.92 TRINITY_DN1949_c0_g1_i1:173-2764(-)